jgi:hypothetical protein
VPPFKYTVTFAPSGDGKARCEADPKYPDGRKLDAAGARPGCMFLLPYPAEECGVWLIHCHECDMRFGITAAGRADDPRLLRVPCHRKAGAN